MYQSLTIIANVTSPWLLNIQWIYSLPSINLSVNIIVARAQRNNNKWTGAANNLSCQAASASGATPPHFFGLLYHNHYLLKPVSSSYRHSRMIDRTIKEMCSFSSHTSIATNSGTILSLQSSSHHIRIATRLATSFTLYHRAGSSSSISIVRRRPTDWLYVSINL